jgi:N-acyl-D-amino-acid deacylase
MKNVKAAAIVAGLIVAGVTVRHHADPTYAQTPQALDLVIRNGRVFDGTGSPWYRADIGIRGDAIVRIAPAITETAAQVIDAGGQAVTPGFIDIHNHARENIFELPSADNYIRQGVTTIIEGPDGSSPVPLAPFLAKLDELQKSINIGSFVGQGSVRAAVLGTVNRRPTPAELDKMRSIVEDAMKAGAFGLSTGLFYVPGAFTPIEEVIELARVAGRYGGIHISHMRDEAFGVLDSVRETIRIGEEGGLPTQVTHHKIVGPKNYGKSVETLKLLDAARTRGVDATSDQYPYTASSNAFVASMMPQWAQEGGRDQMLARLKNPATRKEIGAETVRIIREERGGGDPKNVFLAHCDFDAAMAGKNLADVARLRGMEPTIENGAEAAMWVVEQGSCQGVYHAMSEQDLERVMRHPATMIASDGWVQILGQGVPHPRSYGTFARVLGVYARERNTLTLEDAIRRMTSFPAQRLRLNDRGILRPGMKADIAIFDPARVRDMATFEKPHQYAIGFSSVIVNGQVVFDGHQMTAARPGKVLYGGQK